jgi:hypothetical protein
MFKGLIIIALCIVYTLMLFSVARVFQTIAWIFHCIKFVSPSVVVASPVMMKCSASVRRTVIRKKDRCCASDPTTFLPSLAKSQSMSLTHRRG